MFSGLIEGKLKMDSSNWVSIIVSHIWSIPYIAAYLIGIVISLVTFGKHAKVSLLALLGFGTLLFVLVVGTALNIWVIHGLDDTSFDRGQFFKISALIRSLLSVVGYGLLITAIFGWRPTAAKAI